ncbi:hypothetical protein CU097_011383 [Rhizopus azygosporus]|uniref:CsbD-like domain-containing protein n=1 Tax=Rhizopus azygosporus TaxID=86630 RepID=A0A367JLU5_RHIAZ|nr:hypothetical protein CU097_011383 [Rhizopus azygosporus]
MSVILRTFADSQMERDLDKTLSNDLLTKVLGLELNQNQFMGNVKEGAGNMMGNERMQSEGQTQQGAGNVQETAANVTGYVKGAMDQAAGAMKGAFNSLTGNTTGEAGNKVQQKKGEAQKDWNS